MRQIARNGIRGQAQDLVNSPMVVCIILALGIASLGVPTPGMSSFTIWDAPFYGILPGRPWRSKKIPSSLVLGCVLSNPVCRSSSFLHSPTHCIIRWRMIPDVSVKTVILWMLIRCNLPLLIYVGHCVVPSQRVCNDSLWILRQRFFREKNPDGAFGTQLKFPSCKQWGHMLKPDSDVWLPTRPSYLIASRSPPSHDPKLLSFFRICPLPGTHFYHFGLPFGVTFASLGPLLEHFGCKKTDWDARGATRDTKVIFSQH